MVNTLRRFSKPMMIVITVVVVVVFIAWSPNISHNSDGLPAANIYGQPISQDQWQRQFRKFEVYAKLGMTYARMLGQDANKSLAVARSIVFENEADRLGITVTDEQKFGILRELIEATSEEDSKRQLQYVQQTILNPLGFPNDALADFLTGEARMQRARDVIGANVGVTPEEVNARLRDDFMRTEVSYVQLAPSEFTKNVAVSEEDMKKDYEERKGQFMTPPERKVRYAAFLIAPPPEGKPYTEKERNLLLQAAANKAYDFRQALNEPGAQFEELAKQFGGVVKTTAEFFSQDNPPNELEQIPAIGTAAFALTKENPYSKELTLTQNFEKGAYVLAYGEEKAPESLSYESVKEKIKTDLVASKASTLMQEKAKEIRAKLVEAKAAGKTFYEAAEALGRKPVPFPALGRRLPPPPQDAFSPFILPLASKLAPGELSEPVPMLDGTVIVAHLDQRIVDDPGPALLELFKNAVLEEKKNLAFVEWLKGRTRAAGVVDAKFL